ncbi:MAG: RNA-guided pseudouridylation complex pseudouridine synthase subunit Cbf5 [Desulfurococcaceae archaeon]|uniref:Probable tRNA pseudouridine synthase B n=1 Tax=Staphylothermus marinus TaxID=2280 RepID=A0A7C4JL40_STAMA
MGLVEKAIRFIDNLTLRSGYSNDWFVLRESDSDPQYGYLPWSRPVEQHLKYGVINLDKPPGPTSHEVVAWIKRIMSLSKAGHGGTLDPKVTGVLPIGLENSTKVIGSVIHTVKEYVMVIQLHGDVDFEKFRNVVENFRGSIYQKPPLRSRVKRAVRVRRIYEIEVLEMKDKLGLIRVLCDPGTYMRKLAHDIGILLGTGCHMRELRRIRTGPFKEDETLVTMQDVSEAVYLWRSRGVESLLRRVVLPVEQSIAHLPKIMILDSAVGSIVHGADLAVPGISRLTRNIQANSIVSILTLKGELVALGRALKSFDEIVKLDKGIVVKTLRVVMERGLYPRLWRSRG